MARSSQGHTMMLHTYNPQPMSLSGINSPHPTVPEILSGQDFSDQGHCGMVKGQARVIP